ncbi:hypothetical protein [Priestia koreensis]|uniref:hypothetical protein n=1 Tax=Priestia koreensis TaxID=284581 RepID=UPI001F55BEB5|nr:hypothetical protein [Priestia koreensis]UNL83633.1 hypothetical protein IE339_15860 [Priestia koreensis]
MWNKIKNKVKIVYSAIFFVILLLCKPFFIFLYSLPKMTGYVEEVYIHPMANEKSIVIVKNLSQFKKEVRQNGFLKKLEENVLLQ